MNGAPAKPISGVGAELGDQLAAPPSAGTSSRSGSSGGSASTSATDRIGCGDDRPDAGLDLDVDPGHDQRQHDVGEEDRGVHPVPADRLQGDLGDQVRVLAGLEHRRPGAQRPVLRQRPAGLAHEPDRGPAHRAGRGRRGPGPSRRAGSGGTGSGATVTTGHPPRRRAAFRPGSGSVGRGTVAARRERCAIRRPTLRTWSPPAWPAPGAEAGTRAGTNPPPRSAPPWRRCRGSRARPEIVLEHIPAPQRLAPWAHAVGARVAEPDGDDDDLEIASARFIVLFDPDGHEAWNGTTRCVGYLSAGPTRNSSTTRCSPRSPGAG